MTKQIRDLYADGKYEMPAKQLNRLALTKADNQKNKVYKLHGDLSRAQQKTFKVDQQQLKAATNIFSVQDTLSVELGKDQLLKDENFKVEDFNNDFAYLLAHKAKFAASIKDKATTLDREVKAIALVKAATTGDPDPTKIDQVRDAINAVDVKTFKDKYLSKIDDVNRKLFEARALSGSSKIYDKDGNEVSTYDKFGNLINNETSGAKTAPSNPATGGQTSSASATASQRDSSSAQPSTSKVLGVSFISQEAADAPEGCEAASTLQALHYKGHASGMSLASFLKTISIASNGNPYQGFGGTPLYCC